MSKPIATTVVMMTTFVVIITSCARAPIEEIARRSIQEKAKEALTTYSRIVQGTDPGSSDLVRKLEEAMPGVYAVTPIPGGRPTADIYLRDHVTTSGGFWAEQRTVNACVRYSYDTQTATMKSIDCPTTGPPAEYADEHVAIP